MNLKQFSVFFLCVGCCLCVEDNPAVVLMRSGAAISNIPLQSEIGKQSNVEPLNTRIFIDDPKRDDLAISRLQTKVRRVVTQLWENIGDQQRFAILKEKGAISEVLKTFSENLRNDVFALENQIESSKIESVLQLMKVESNKESTSDWTESLETFQKSTGKINLLYGYLDGYFTNPEDATQIVLEDYARSILQSGSSQDESVAMSLSNLHTLTVPQNRNDNELHDGRRGRQNLGGARGVQRNDLFYKLYSILKDQKSPSLCDLGQSPQQMMFNLYNLVSLTEVMGFAVLEFSYLILHLANRANYTDESLKTISTFDIQTEQKLTEIRNVLSKTPRNFFMCDAEKQVEGITYITLKKFLQGHMENEVDMNSQNSCKDSCQSYKVAEPHSCFKSLFCAKQPTCNGRLFDCTFYHADSWVCMSNDANRKYDWIEYEDGQLLGNKGQCVNKIKVDSWWRWLFWHCSYCLCKCDAPGPDSDRYWSLRPALSDVAKNKIVTGARLVKKNRIVMLEIEEATALPEGFIDESTRTWSLGQPMNIDDAENFKKDVDYFMMSYEHRALDIDVLDAPIGQVITGIKFRSLGRHINLEIQVTPITFKTGKLLSDRSSWIGNDNTPVTIEPRQLVKIEDPDIPTKLQEKSTIGTTHNQYILFDTTSAKKDVMQTTIPFIDSQPVQTTPGTWLSGVGIYHKGASGYGGYVGLQLKTYDNSRHLVAENEAINLAQRKAKKIRLN